MRISKWFYDRFEWLIDPDAVVLRILRAAAPGGMVGLDIMRASGSPIFGWGYVSLLRLEDAGKIRSEWVAGPYPRTRKYFLVKED